MAWKYGAEVEPEEVKCMGANFVKLIEVLRAANQQRWDHALYLPHDRKKWALDTNALVLDPEDVENPDNPSDDPIIAKSNNYRYVLMIQDIQSIVENARMQKPASDQVLYDAFMYYLEHDAFISF